MSDSSSSDVGLLQNSPPKSSNSLPSPVSNPPGDQPMPRLTLLMAAALITGTAYAQAPLPPSITQSFGTLADQPATHTGFVFDRSMMQIAQGLLESGGVDSKRAAAAISSISVDNYRYAQRAFYTPECMTSIIAAYHAAGWKHLVDAHATPANTAQPHATATDVWLHFSGADI